MNIKKLDNQKYYNLIESEKYLIAYYDSIVIKQNFRKTYGNLFHFLQYKNQNHNDFVVLLL